MINSIKILGVPIKKVTKDHFLGLVKETIEQNKKLQVATVNAEFLVAIQKDQELFEILQSSFNTTDAVALLWASFFLTCVRKFPKILRWLVKLILFLPTLILTLFADWIYKIIPERLSGADLIWDLTKLASDNQFKVFLLGAGLGVAEKAAENLKKKYPTLNIVGAEMGDNLEPQTLQTKIRQSETNLLFVAYGAPKQEKWINENLPKLNNNLVAIGIGGTLDFVSGRIKRAPLWLRKIGLEWLYRLMLEPKKRIKRIFKAVFVFPWLILIKG